MIWDFIDVFKNIANNDVRDDDFADRLSRRYSIVLLIISLLLIGSSQFVGKPIECWTPAHFTDSMNEYTNNICWIANTYYVPTNESLPKPNETRSFRINYYQWVPFILVLMTFLFYVPFAFWRLLSKHHSIRAKSVMNIISTMDQTSSEEIGKCINTVCDLIDRSIYINRDWDDVSWWGKLIKRKWLKGVIQGSYIVRIYLITKLLYIINVCGQLVALNYFLRSKDIIFGIEFFHDVRSGKEFWESSRFPRVTMCDFTIRTLGENNQLNTIQCTLPINLFNEKIFIFIWFWLVLVSFISIYYCILWMMNLFNDDSRKQFIERYLNLSDFNTEKFHKFVFEYLKQDEIFLLRIVKENTNDLIVGELISALWTKYKCYSKYTLETEDLNIDEEKTIH